MMLQLQRKALSLSSCELKFAKGDEGTFAGYLSMFDNVDSYGDVVRKGAYEDTLKEWADKGQLPPMLLNHNAYSELPIGIWKAMEEDEKGLRVEGELTPQNPTSEKVFAAMKHGALSGLSIGYRKARFEENDNGGFDLLKIDLREGSVVSAPANDQALIDRVKFEGQDTPESWRDAEYILRDVGLSAAAAKFFISTVKDIAQRDVADIQQELDELKRKLEGTERAERLHAGLKSLRAHL